MDDRASRAETLTNEKQEEVFLIINKYKWLTIFMSIITIILIIALLCIVFASEEIKKNIT